MGREPSWKEESRSWRKDFQAAVQNKTALPKPPFPPFRLIKSGFLVGEYILNRDEIKDWEERVQLWDVELERREKGSAPKNKNANSSGKPKFPR